jgi:uncharacterized protein YukE
VSGAAVPGAPELTAIAAQVAGDPSTIRAIADNWAQAAASCGQQTKVVNQAASATQDWTGLGKQSFDYQMSQFYAASSNEQEWLQTGANALHAAADALESAQDQIGSISSGLASYLDLASKLAEANGVTPTGAQNQAIAEATSQAQTVANEAGDALDKASSTLDRVLSNMTGSRAFSALCVPGGQGFIPQVSASDAGNLGNELTVAMYLVEHGYSKAAAAGIAACIAGESSGNPEAVGTGGWGLIGWTPQTPGEYQNLYPTGNSSADLAKQLPAILAYNNANGNVAALNSITDPVQAADYYSQTFERPLVTDSDVRPDVATAVFKALGG